MSGAERAAFDAHAAWLRRLLADGLLIAAGPCLGQVNTGIAIFEAASEGEAQRIVADEPVTSGGYMRGDLRPFRLGILRGLTARRVIGQASLSAASIGRVTIGAEASVWYGRCCAPTVTPSWSARAATCGTGACCTPIPACRCR